MMEKGTLAQGRYRIVEPIGSGGMSDVFAAYDEQLKRPVALKILHQHLAKDPAARERFSREAMATARLHHPNIVEIFDVANLDSPEAFIVTELVRGQMLKTLMEATPFAPPVALPLAVMIQLAQALEQAHRQGIIHRDLKPENIMLTEEGVLKLMDFGIARILDDHIRMTVTGALVGSPLHMAPEIIAGEQATLASDIFSAGTIFYWLCCGKPPFIGANALQTMHLIFDGKFEDPRISAPYLSDQISDLIFRCLAKFPNQRPKDGAELKKCLLALTSESNSASTLLAEFIRAPKETRQTLAFQESGRLIGKAEQALMQKPPQVPLALSLVDRALANTPNNPKAQSLLNQVRQTQTSLHRQKKLKRLAAAGMALMSLIFIGGGLARKLNANSTPKAQRDVSAIFSKASSKKFSPLQTASIPFSEMPAADFSTSPTAQHSSTTSPHENAFFSPDFSVKATEVSRSESQTIQPSENSSTLEPTEKKNNFPEDFPVTKTTEQKLKTLSRHYSEQKSPVKRQKIKKSQRRIPSNIAPENKKTRRQNDLNNEQNKGELSVMIHQANRGLTWGTIFIDGEQMNDNAPSWKGILDVGAHRIEVQAPCCLSQVRHVRILPGQANPPLIFQLQPKPAALSVRGGGERCEIWLKGLRLASCIDTETTPIRIPMVKGKLRSQIPVRILRPGKPDLDVKEKFEAGKLTVLTLE